MLLRKAPSKSLPKMRDTNLELFRIITMLLIIAHHYVVNSGLTDPMGPIYTAPTAKRSLFLLLFGAWGKIGINCFVLITGYFMCKSSISLQKFSKLLLEVMFYRFVIHGIFWVSGYTKFTTAALLKLFLPITKIETGFTSAYLVFFLCIPFINILIHNLTQKQHTYLLLLVLFIYVFMGTFKSTFHVTMNYVSWYIVLYFIASYIRLYPQTFYSNTCLWCCLTVLFVSLSALSVIFGAYWKQKTGLDLTYFFVTDSNTFLALATGLSSFMFFKNLKVRYCPLINTLATTCFGVLQIHANSDIMRNWLWRDTLNNVGVYSQSWMPIHALLSVLFVFLICAVIDLLRTYLLEKPFFCFWNRCETKIVILYKKFESYIFHKLNIIKTK